MTSPLSPTPIAFYAVGRMGRGWASVSAGWRQTLRNGRQCPGRGSGCGGHHHCALIPGSRGWVEMAGTVWLMAGRERGLGQPTSFSAAHPDLTSRRQEKECPLGRPGLGFGSSLMQGCPPPSGLPGSATKATSKMPACCQPTGAEAVQGCHSVGQDC